MSLDNHIDDVPGLKIPKNRFLCDPFFGRLEGLAEHLIEDLVKIFLGVEFVLFQLGPGPFVDHRVAFLNNITIRNALGFAGVVKTLCFLRVVGLDFYGD